MTYKHQSRLSKHVKRAIHAKINLHMASLFQDSDVGLALRGVLEQHIDAL